MILKDFLNNSYIRDSVKIEYFFVCLLFKKFLWRRGFWVTVTLDFLICMILWLVSGDCVIIRQTLVWSAASYYSSDLSVKVIQYNPLIVYKETRGSER